MIKNKIFIGGVGISNLNFNQVLEKIERYMEHGAWSMEHGEQGRAGPLVIFTPNPEIIVYGQKDSMFRRIVNSAQISIPDGQGIVWASKILGTPIKERISGADLLEKLVELAAKKGLIIGLIGGRSGIAIRALECLEKKYPRVQGWAEEGPRVEIANSKLQIANSYEMNLLIDKIRKTDILFVGMGAPKQEYFISNFKFQMDAIAPKANNRYSRRMSGSNFKLTIMAVGGAFDYLAGQVPRAPFFIRKIGFEWLFRLLHQPWRLKRQLALLRFIWLIFKQKFVS